MHSLFRLARRLLAVPLLVLPVLAWAAFTDNGNGTVTDTVTGLMWDKCSWGQTNNTTCGGGVATEQAWADALALVVTANSTNYKGHNDWRLPNKNELVSLVDANSAFPNIDTVAFPNVTDGYYRTSTTVVEFPSQAWSVTFFGGRVGNWPKDHAEFVRLVRGGQSFDALAAPPPAPSPTQIPTLSEWGMLLLGALLMASAWIRMRVRSSN